MNDGKRRKVGEKKSTLLHQLTYLPSYLGRYTVQRHNDKFNIGAIQVRIGWDHLMGIKKFSRT